VEIKVNHDYHFWNGKKLIPTDSTSENLDNILCHFIKFN